MNVVKNLTVLRRATQFLMFVFLVYGSVIVGHYAADKISGALPALSCAYDQMNADYCALIPLQHQFHHRLAPAVETGNLFALLMPVLTTMATFLLMFVVLNKAFCGWVCPLGFFQEVMQIIGQKLGLRKVDSLSHDAVDKIRPIKWLMLGGLVFGFPALTSLGFMSDEWGDPFCQICPSRILTTLLTADTDQVFVDTSTTSFMFLSILGDFLFGLTLALAMTMRQPFCRICPMLALHAVFRKLGLARLVKKGTSRCNKCGLCAEACPMDIRELQTEFNETDKPKDITKPDCTLCGRCVEFCPDKDVLQLRYLNVPVFNASPKYFKERKKAQKQWDKIQIINLAEKPKAKA